MVSSHDAGAIVGLLADADRRRCYAALELGARSSADVVVSTGLTAVQVAKALGRLVGGGLVATADDGGFVVVGSAFQAAARVALKRPDDDDHDGLPDDLRKVLRAFVIDGRITQIPASAGKRRILLDWLSQYFDPGTRYSEAMVNLILGQRHPDTASLRRYMVDEGILDRADGQYWRDTHR